ncbi:MAG: hypothetical protein KBH30_12560, partial [Ferruginibacter sp.]|nr:hypothetical protein [Ferruginibacter sp.]
AGFIGTYTGGTAFAAMGGTAVGGGGFLAGAYSAGIGYTASTAFGSIGNAAYFGDPLPTADQFAKGLAFSMFTGGTLNGINAAAHGNNFWTGDAIARGRGIFSFNNTAKPITDAPLKPLEPIRINELKPYNSSYQSPSEIKIPEQLSHYASKDPSEWTSLGTLADEPIYLTPNSELSRVGALNDLALPKVPNFRMDINGAAIDPNKIMLIRRVTGNVFGQGGGGWEIIYKGPLDLSKVNVVVTPLP